jgi:hypothetical protein
MRSPLEATLRQEWGAAYERNLALSHEVVDSFESTLALIVWLQTLICRLQPLA